LPEVEPGRGGTSPLSWDQDRAELCRLLRGFVELRSFVIHPMWGEMSQREWLIWGYRHVDHHLRQFGV
jgi:hypothetical protein